MSPSSPNICFGLSGSTLASESLEFAAAQGKVPRGDFCGGSWGLQKLGNPEAMLSHGQGTLGLQHRACVGAWHPCISNMHRIHALHSHLGMLHCVLHLCTAPMHGGGTSGILCAAPVCITALCCTHALHACSTDVQPGHVLHLHIAPMHCGVHAGHLCIAAVHLGTSALQHCTVASMH